MYKLLHKFITLCDHDFSDWLMTLPTNEAARSTKISRPLLSGFLYPFQFQDFSVYLKILAAYLQPSVIASFLRTHIQQYSVQEDEFCRFLNDIFY